MAAETDHDLFSEGYARYVDSKDELRHYRDEFIIPTLGDLERKSIAIEEEIKTELWGLDWSLPSVYLCGNSLGLQPRRTRTYLQQYLDTWGTKGVNGHFTRHTDALTRPWVDIDEDCAAAIAPIVGAEKDEVAVMQSLTANLHLLMASFYKPTVKRWKIIMEEKAFPSDHYAVYSQVAHHGFPDSSVVLIPPSSPSTHYLSTQSILDTITAHADTTALILLPGVHFYSGQLLDIPTITAHAHSHGITIGWDLAHAVGNVPLRLHEWGVDFAAWCSYKYLNAGAGSIGGLFVHEQHWGGKVETEDIAPGSAAEQEANGHDTAPPTAPITPSLRGWWGSTKGTRFAMDNTFAPMRGAAAWQLSNPSVLDCTALLASLSIFNEVGMDKLRAKSVLLTGGLIHLLDCWPGLHTAREAGVYEILTPKADGEHGAQVSIRLQEGLLARVMTELERVGVVVDERKPDVVRVAPAPLYNGWQDVWRFMDAFERAVKEAIRRRDGYCQT
ncbi:kynureninase [Trichodelitschia bisporula]|uniref:Kynureninase n=1 Tax=Trichodelitschia bisporula TaxID=703511 RepID=A0A6G1HRG8_9PEZI|nr:kynureninase [Trichodelitschia bisporula]